MKNCVIKIVFIFTFLYISFSCKKEGTGGDATVSTITKHHIRIIPLTTVYIKYGATEFPGTDPGSYDASQKTDNAGHTHFESLRHGDYYFYATGYDSLAQAPVKGGLGLKISKKEKKSEIELVIPITE